MKQNIGKLVMALTLAGFSVGITSTMFLTSGCSTSKNQAESLRIIRQPQDQMARLGSKVALTVQAANGPCTYQWLRNDLAVKGQTSPTLGFEKVEVKDAGYYSCDISSAGETVASRTANLEVFTTSIDPRTLQDPMTIYSSPVFKRGTQGGCPGTYVGFVTYTNPTTGFGWVPDTNATVFTATDGTEATNTKIYYMGYNGDANCGVQSVTIPNVPPSPSYEFLIYFPKKVPTTNYPIILTGFLP